MDNKDIYKPLIAFAQTYKDTLSQLNQGTMRYFESETVKNTLMNTASAIKSTLPANIKSPDVQESVKHILKSYTDILVENDLECVIDDSMKSAIAKLQVNSLFQISQYTQTPMVRDITECFAKAQYESLAGILNYTVSSEIVAASDISFFKMSELVIVLKPELVYPRGLSSSLGRLSKRTANDIAGERDLKYCTATNMFLSSDGEVDSLGLNVICSGKEVLNASTDELFSETELIDFCSFLSQTPMLAYNSPTGKKIFEFIRELYLNGTQSISFDKNTYYHCRSRNKNDHPFTFDLMLKAPHGIPWAGRYNQVGRSHYYFSDTRKGAETEIMKHISNEDVLQTVKIKPVKDIELLDLSSTLLRGKTFLHYLRYSLSDVNDKMPREYLIPCYVSDCCKEIGFDGIKYYGSKEYSNYVVWSDGYFDSLGMCD